MSRAAVKIDDKVPTQDSASNLIMRDVIGNKTDTHNGDSLYALNKTQCEHFHTAGKVYPTLAAGVNVADGAAPWTLGAGFTNIVPINTITNDFDIHAISVEQLSGIGVFEIVLYYGVGNTEAARIRTVRTAQQESALNIPVQTIVIPANSQIDAKLATDVGNRNTDISIFYHEY